MSTRTLIKTSTPGWYVDPDNPEKRVRKRPEDRILSQEEFDQMIAEAEEAAQQKREQRHYTVLSTNKLAVGPTVEIQCIEPGCERTRVIKVQDKFQVKRCVPHQKEHRNRHRRERRKAKAQQK